MSLIGRKRHLDRASHFPSSAMNSSYDGLSQRIRPSDGPMINSAIPIISLPISRTIGKGRAQGDGFRNSSTHRTSPNA
jgi:hypothetical protein